MSLGLPFREIWCIDFEFLAPVGENPQPVCLVAKEVGTGRLVRLWQDQLGPEPPFKIDDDTLIVAYYAPAEIGCFLSLGWPVPTMVIDLYAEFRRETNALAVADGRGLLSALSRHHITRITSEEKKSGRDLVMRDRRHLLASAAGSHAAADCTDVAGVGPSVAQRPLHGRRGPHGADRRADRPRDADSYS